MLSMLCKNFIRQDSTFFFLFAPEKKALEFHANCLLRDNLHEMSKPYFLGKKRKIFKKKSSADFVY